MALPLKFIPEEAFRKKLNRHFRARVEDGELVFKNEMVETAINLAWEAHKDDHPRKSMDPYYEGHILPVALFAHDLALNTNRLARRQGGRRVRTDHIIAVGLLHDALENAANVVERQRMDEIIRGTFGPRSKIYQMVKLLTKEDLVIPPHAKDDEILKLRREREVRYVERMDKSRYARELAIVKLADRCHNYSTLQYKEPEHQAEKVKETRQVYLPFFASHAPENLDALEEVRLIHQVNRLVDIFKLRPAPSSVRRMHRN